MISLILTTMIAAASQTTPAVPIGNFSFTSTMNGSPIGTSAIVVTSTGVGTKIQEQGSGSFQGMSASVTATMMLAHDLSPGSYAGTYNVAGENAASSVTFPNGVASVLSSMGPKALFALGGAKHYVVLDVGLVAGFVALPAQMHAWSGNPIQVLAPDYSQAGILTVDPNAAPARPAAVSASDASLSLTGQIPLTVWYNPTTYLTDEVDVPSQGLVVTRVR